MSEFVKKTMMGYREVPGGQSDPECTHVILTAAEYTKLLRKISDAEQKARDEKRKAEEKEKESQNREQQTIQKANQDIEVWKKELEKERTESAYQKGLNENLLRIARERANADRKLKPKKEHSGYVVVMSSEKEYKYKADRRHWDSVVLWETVLQTPYSIEFTEEQARKQIRELLKLDEQGNWLIGRIGINASYSGSYEDMMDNVKWTEDEKAEMNIMLTRKLRANFKAGYWELVFLHTKPLGAVPKDMRA